MPLLADRTQETTTTTGTGTLTLAGAVTGYVTFNSSFSNGNIVFYTIDDGAGNWEEGFGTVGTGTLTRSTVIASSNAGNLVNLAAGTKRVYCSAPTRTLLPDQTSNSSKVLTTDGTSPSWTAAINGVSVGVTTQAAGNFTTLGATGNVTLGDASTDTLTINGTAVSIPNNLNFDSDTLFIDAANNRIGIGTSAPATTVEIAGTTVVSYSAAGTGGLARFTTTNTESGAGFSFAGTSTTFSDATWGGTSSADAAVLRVNSGSGNGLIFYTDVAIPISFSTNRLQRLNIDGSGNFQFRQNTNAANTSVSFNTTVQNALTLDSTGALLVGVATKNAGSKVTVSDSFGLQGTSARTVEKVVLDGPARSSIIVDITGGVDGSTFYVEIKMAAYNGFYANYSYAVYKANSWTSYGASVVNSQLSTSPALTVTPDLATAGRLRFTLAGTNMTVTTTLVKVICAAASDPVIAISYT